MKLFLLFFILVIPSCLKTTDKQENTTEQVQTAPEDCYDKESIKAVVRKMYMEAYQQGINYQADTTDQLSWEADSVAMESELESKFK
jgi:hypothetical protein